MEYIQLLALFLIFVCVALLMFFRKIPALLALPLMAFFIPIVSGVSFEETLSYVFGLGAVKLHTAYTVAIFGSMLSILMQKTGIAENLIKKGAELAGDNPFIIALIMLILIALLFTTLGGLGAIIMVAGIVLPIMSSVGLAPITVVGIFLIGLSMGGILNAGNWAVYVDVLQLEISEIRTFALIMFLVTFLMAVSYLLIQIYRDGHELNYRKIALRLLTLFILALVFYFLSNLYSDFFGQVWYYLVISTILIIKLTLFILVGLSIFKAFLNGEKKQPELYWTAYFAPVIPLVLILVFDMNFIAAFIAGLIYGFVATYRKGSINLLVQSLLEGGSVVMPAVILMIGIGMLLVAIMGPGADIYTGQWPVLELVRPFLQTIVPTSIWIYVAVFSLAAPFALYRGPLNVWGMGYGLAAVFLASGMVPGAIMGLLIAVGQVQGVSDPTNTHNVWLANEMRVDVQKILWNTLPYTWAAAIIGLIISGIIYY